MLICEEFIDAVIETLFNNKNNNAHEVSACEDETMQRFPH